MVLWTFLLYVLELYFVPDVYYLYTQVTLLFFFLIFFFYYLSKKIYVHQDAFARFKVAGNLKNGKKKKKNKLLGITP